MKNKIFLLLILLFFTSSSYALAADTVISDSAKQKEIMDSFNDVNQYTNTFFTPHVSKYVKIDRNAPQPKEIIDENTIYPVKKLRYKWEHRNEPKVKKASIETNVAPSEEEAILDCDEMEYHAEKTELEADGHVLVNFTQNKSSIKADKMIYNQTSNLIKAFGNVVLINDGKTMTGDYMQIDMNEENALMDHPVTEEFRMRARAQKGYMYGDKMIQEQGNMYVTKKTMIDIKSDMFGPDLDTMFVNDKDKSYFKKDGHGEKFKIKTQDLIINSKKDHDTITLKHAEIYFNERKIGTIPSITMHTNKGKNFVEADYPEIGSVTNMGMYAGPGFVFDTPKGSTLKILPILNYQSNGDNSSENAFGFGALAKFKNATNKTDFGYGTANKIFLMRGLQKLDENMFLQYSANSYMDDWFMGFRMPKLMSELVYFRDFPIYDFFGKDKDLVFTHRITGGYVQSGDSGKGLLDNDDGVGTLRFKYMAEVAQTLYKFNDPYTSPINGRLELVAQGSTALYGTGNTQFVGRIGPRIHSQYKNWMQDAGYFLSAYDDKTPLKTFDPYMYGRSNVYLRESFRLCKYLTLSWFGSLNLMQDSWDGKLLQENSFFFAIGPDDVKLNIGYDTIRQQTFVTMAMHLDAKGSTVEYKKMTIKNPDTFGKTKDGKTMGSQSSFLAAPEEEGAGIERAEIVNIEEAL